MLNEGPFAYFEESRKVQIDNIQTNTFYLMKKSWKLVQYLLRYFGSDLKKINACKTYRPSSKFAEPDKLGANQTDRYSYVSKTHLLSDVIVSSSNQQGLDDVSSSWLFNCGVQCCLQSLCNTLANISLAPSHMCWSLVFRNGTCPPPLLRVRGACGHWAGATELMPLGQNILSMLQITTEQHQGRFITPSP